MPSGGLKTIEITDSGARVVDKPAQSIENEVSRRVEERVGQASATRAAQKLRALRARAGEKPKATKHVLGEDESLDAWFVRQITMGDLREIQLRCPRDWNGVIDVSGGDDWAQFTCAVLYVCLGSDESGARFFEQNDGDWNACWDMANTTDVDLRSKYARLVAACLIDNPDILPVITEELKQVMETTRATLELMSADFLAETGAETESSMPHDEKPPSGSEPITGTEPPSSSPTDFAATSEAPAPTPSDVTAS